MKIVFYLEDVDIGGQQTMNYYYAKNIDKSNHEIYTAYYLDGRLKEYFERISNEVTQLDEPPKRWSKAVRNPFHIIQRSIQFHRFIQDKKIDMVLSNGPYVYIIAAIACFFSKAKHGRLLGKEPSKEKFLWKFFHLIPLHRFTDLFFGFSYGNKELLSKGVKKEKVINMGYGVDSQKFTILYSESKRLEHRRALGIDDNDLVIAWVGRLYEKINGRDGELVFSLQMAKRMKEKGFNQFKFLVVGDGEWSDGLKTRVEEYGITEQMIYMGWKLPEEIPHFLNLIDIFPLLDYDVIGGSKLRESMSCGRTVISVSGDSGYQAEWITNGVNGILVSPDNFIEEAADVCIELSKDPKKIESIGIEGRKYAITQMDFSVKGRILEEACEKIVYG